ncbi:CarD family transcriptional regulator [Candidatus Desulfarcum epimagneticum]|uniref:CarD family transcriptional regulator n=1 Tax=uncultured Desulfobacteraceae bacterium TaxID=218296 RepID=A0A484HGG7_9BACT|nr:CarD family transcriptional regulator [uncultured Desulfobacteraceae bacterium]
MTDKSTQEEPDAGSKETRTFQVGSLAVYPAHGVGVIEAIESKVVNGERHDFYIMKVLDNGMVIMIPTWNVESVGLRDIIDEKDIPKVYDVIRSRRQSSSETQTWNRRYRDYMDKIRKGSLYDVAEVFRDLSILKLTKDLSFGERKLYDTAQILLVKELSTARNMDEKEILEEIESFFVEEKQADSDAAPGEDAVEKVDK